jgi:glycosyltransferase involved in cell wall biosynthesis
MKTPAVRATHVNVAIAATRLDLSGVSMPIRSRGPTIYPSIRTQSVNLDRRRDRRATISFVTEGPRPGASSDPLVSIITPVLNGAGTIKHTLTSVAAQTYRAIEHIVVDGGSTDDTLEIVESSSRAARLPVRWISEPDRGMYAAINKGLRLAKGDILAYLNSDDLYFPWTVGAAVRALQQGSDFVFGDVAIITRSAQTTTFRLQFYRRFDANYYIHREILAQATVFWTRRAMERIGPFDPSLQYLGDVELWARAGVAGLKFHHLHEVLALVLEHEGSLSTRRAKEIREELASIRASFADRIEPSGAAWAAKRLGAIRWRWRQRDFRRQARRARPRRWRGFIELLRQIDVEVGGSGILMLFLPSGILSKWPRVRRWVDSPDEFERRTLLAIQARASQGECGLPRD